MESRFSFLPLRTIGNRIGANPRIRPRCAEGGETRRGLEVKEEEGEVEEEEEKEEGGSARAMHRCTVARKGGEEGPRTIGGGGGGWTRRKRVTLHGARRRWASDDRSLRDRRRETPRPSRFCHVRQVRRPAAAVVVVDVVPARRRSTAIPRAREKSACIRAARFSTNFSIGKDSLKSRDKKNLRSYLILSENIFSTILS